MEFRDGDAVAPLAVAGDAGDKRGTEVTFLPAKTTFTMTEFDFATLEHRLRELAFLNSGVTIVLSDMRHAVEKREEMRYEGGVEAFVKYLDRNKNALIPTPIMIKAERDGITVECALSWNDSYHETVLCFTNNIPQRDGGTHLAGFRGALTRQVTGYAETLGGARKEKVALTGDDCREGLTAVLSVKVPIRSSRRRPRTSWSPRKCGRWSRASSTTRWRPGSRSIPAKPRSSSARWSRPPPRAKRRARRASSRGARARSTSPRCPASSPTARSATRRSPSCSSSRATRAGGSAKQGRNREFQAVLPLRGKILNVERVRFDKMLASQEIGTLITALGTGIGREEFNRRQAALPQDHHHDGRRRRRRPHPHAAADVLLPADAGADRARPPLHRAAAALQSHARQVRAISQGRARARGLPDRDRARGGRAQARIRRGARRRRPARRWSRRRA